MLRGAFSASLLLLFNAVPALAQYDNPPPDPNPELAHTIYFAQIGNGGGFVSSIVLANPSSRVASGTIEFIDDEGRPLRLGIARDTAKASMGFRIQPLGSVIIETDGSGDSIASGSAIVKSDNPISGVVVFTAGPAAGGLGSAGVGESAPARSFIVPVTRSAADQINSGVALMNASNFPAELELSLRSADGIEVDNGRTTITLAARGHKAQFIDQLFPQANTSSFRGTLVVRSNQPVAATALVLGFGDAKFFTTLPVAPLR